MSLESPRLAVADIIGEASSLVGARAPSFLIAAVVYAAFSTWADDPEWSWTVQLVLMITAILVQGLLQYILFRRAYGDAGGGWVAVALAPLIAITLQLLIWIVTALGYVLLLLPGLYLAGRLSAAIGMASVERTGLIASITGSWRRTRRCAWPLVIVQGILLLPLVALGVGIVAATHANGGVEYSSIEFRALTNLALAALTMAGWAVAGAVFRLTSPQLHDPEDIFG